MALESKLIIEGHPYNVLECEYEFNQAVDITGRPSDRPRGGMINIIIAAPDDRDLMFHEWMRDKTATKEGQIALKVNRENIDSNKSIFFKDAYCVRLYEYFNNNNSVQMYMKISIMAGIIIFGNKNNGCEFVNID